VSVLWLGATYKIPILCVSTMCVRSNIFSTIKKTFLKKGKNKEKKKIIAQLFLILERKDTLRALSTLSPLRNPDLSKLENRNRRKRRRGEIKEYLSPFHLTFGEGARTQNQGPAYPCTRPSEWLICRNKTTSKNRIKAE
jgi:hypothetical protein